MGNATDASTGLTVGRYVQLDATFSAAGEVVSLLSEDLASRAAGSGAVYEGEASVQVVTATALDRLTVRINPDTGSGEAGFWGSAEQTAVVYPEATAPMRVCTDRIAAAGATVAAMQWRLQVRGIGAGAASVRVWLPRVRRVS